MKDTVNVPALMTKEDVTTLILIAKKRTGMKWEEIAEAIGMSPVWTHSACMGMNAMPKVKAEALVALLDLPEEFGDGIMSAIDFDMKITRVANPKGDRVKVEMSGKFLGYNSW